MLQIDYHMVNCAIQKYSTVFNRGGIQLWPIRVGVVIGSTTDDCRLLIGNQIIDGGEVRQDLCLISYCT